MLSKKGSAAKKPVVVIECVSVEDSAPATNFQASTLTTDFTEWHNFLTEKFVLKDY